MLEKLNDPDAAAREFQRVEAGRVGPSGLAALQRARLEIRRGRLAEAEKLLLRPSLAREPGRVEGLLHLAERRAETGGRRRSAARARRRRGARARPPARRALEVRAPVLAGPRRGGLGRRAGALQGYADVLAARPWTAVGHARERAHPRAARGRRTAFLRAERARGEALLRPGGPRGEGPLLPSALLGDAAARDLLKVAYRALPRYADVLLAPDLPG